MANARAGLDQSSPELLGPRVVEARRMSSSSAHSPRMCRRAPAEARGRWPSRPERESCWLPPCQAKALYTFDNTRNKSPHWLRIPIQRFYSILLGSTSPTIFTWFRRRLDAIHQNSISYGVLSYTTFLASYGCLRLLKQYSTFSTVRYTVSVTVFTVSRPELEMHA